MSIFNDADNEKSGPIRFGCIVMTILVKKKSRKIDFKSWNKKIYLRISQNLILQNSA